jgi:hypothetical protein
LSRPEEDEGKNTNFKTVSALLKRPVMISSIEQGERVYGKMMKESHFWEKIVHI